METSCLRGEKIESLHLSLSTISLLIEFNNTLPIVSRWFVIQIVGENICTFLVWLTPDDSIIASSLC